MKIDKFGYLLEPDLHDGDFLGLLLNGNKVTLHARASSGEIITIKLINIKYLHSTDFREGNIIGSVKLSFSPDITADQLQRLECYAGPMADKYKDRALRKANSAPHMVFEVLPSYGCELIALCEGVDCIAVNVDNTLFCH